MGDYSELLIKPKPGFSLATTVMRDPRQSGESRETTAYLLQPAGIEWACVVKRHVPRPGANMRIAKKVYEKIPGIYAGPPLDTQNFLDGYAVWVDENVDPATAWLLETCRKRGLHTVCQAIIGMGKMDGRGEINSAWQKVADLLQVHPKWKNTWTGMKSAAIVIATAVQSKHRDDWQLKGRQAFQWIGEKPVYPKEKDEEYYCFSPASAAGSSADQIGQTI